MTNRWSAAKGTTTYKYDQVGNLTNIVYPVSTNIVMRYDALSRLTNMVDAAGATVYGYANQFLASEDGPWDSDTVSYSYANRLRSGLTMLQPNASPWTQNYSYDAANRLQTLSSPAGAFTPTYKGPGNLVTNLALPNGAAITNDFDSVARMSSTCLKKSDGTIINSHSYGYNLAGQRMAMTNNAANYLNYTYDSINQLKTAKGYESGGATRFHEQFAYAYDAAGNLNYRTNNGLVQTFTNNSLNELTSVGRSGTLTVAGTTTGAATNVTVNALTATLYGDKTFSKDSFTVTNGNNTYTAIAQDAYGRKDTNSSIFNLPSSVSFVYDSNGNLTSDGTRGFDYDDENQLIRVTVTNSWKSEFTYDGKFRRRIRKEFTWMNSSWTLTNEVHYIYDGNGMIQERNTSNQPTLTLTRTGRRILARTENAAYLIQPSAAHTYFHTDGNGNVTTLVNGQQIVVAKYIYDPFGNTLSLSGPLGTANLYRFSSQEYHQNSGLLLYLRRAYYPNLQRFINRDPIAEMGGVNLYAYVGNSPINLYDLLGLAGFGDLHASEADQVQAAPPPLVPPFTQEQIANGIAEAISGLSARLNQLEALKNNDLNQWKAIQDQLHVIGTVGQTHGISPTADYWEQSWTSWAEFALYAPQVTWDTVFGDWHQIYTESEALRQTLYLEWLLEQAKCIK